MKPEDKIKIDKKLIDILYFDLLKLGHRTSLFTGYTVAILSFFCTIALYKASFGFVSIILGPAFPVVLVHGVHLLVEQRVEKRMRKL